MSTKTGTELNFEGNAVERAEYYAARLRVIAKLEDQRDEAIAALRVLYDAIPTGFGEDRALNEATKQAERVLGVKQ